MQVITPLLAADSVLSTLGTGSVTTVVVTAGANVRGILIKQVRWSWTLQAASASLTQRFTNAGASPQWCNAYAANGAGGYVNIPEEYRSDQVAMWPSGLELTLSVLVVGTLSWRAQAIYQIL